MHSSETQAATDAAAEAPAAAASAVEQPQASRPERRHEYEPTLEQVTKAWKDLGLMTEELPGEDPRFEFIVSLSMKRQKLLDSMRKQLQGYRQAHLEAHPEDAGKGLKELPTTAGEAKLGRIYTLRKLALGGDRRAAPVLESAYGYLDAKMRERTEALSRLLPIEHKTPNVQKRIENAQRILRWLSELRKSIDILLKQRYPELSQKIEGQKRRAATRAQQPEESTEAADALGGLTPQDVEALLREVGELEPEKPTIGSSELIQEVEKMEAAERAGGAEGEAEKPEQEISPEEKTRRERLAKAIAPELGKESKFAPEVVDLLSGWGFNSVETIVQKQEKGQRIDFARTVIFIDPQNPHLQEDLGRLLKQGTFEKGEQNFAAIFKSLATDPKIGFGAKKAIATLTDNYRLRFPEREDAATVLKFLNAREPKPYAMYMQRSTTDRWNLAAIEATSKQLHYHYQDDRRVPEYHDETLFFASPALTLETKVEAL